MKKYLVLFCAFFFYSCGVALKPHQIGQTRYVYYPEDKQFVTYKNEIAIANTNKMVIEATNAKAAKGETEVADNERELNAIPENNSQQTPKVVMIGKPVTEIDFPILLLDIVLIGYNASLPIVAIGVDYFAHTLYKPIEPASKNSEFKPELTKTDIEYLEAKRRDKSGNKINSGGLETEKKPSPLTQEQIMF